MSWREQDSNLQLEALETRKPKHYQFCYLPKFDRLSDLSLLVKFHYVVNEFNTFLKGINSV